VCRGIFSSPPVVRIKDNQQESFPLARGGIFQKTVRNAFISSKGRNRAAKPDDTARKSKTSHNMGKLFLSSGNGWGRAGTGSGYIP
jgi:hypothetical protein